MNYTITLPDTQKTLPLRDLLEKEWLIPRKVRHFLRVRKNVAVNGQPAMFHHEITAGDTITLTIESSDYQHQQVQPGLRELVNVLYEDEHLIILNKPTGIKTHPNQPDEKDTLLNHLAAYLTDQQQIPYVVHRLDKETSGAIVFAKNPLVLPILGRLLENKEIRRTYQAIVTGSVAENLTIQKKIGRDRHDRRKRVIDERNGQTAITHVQVVQSHSPAQLLCRLDTGRTHQIRVHLASLGHPIIGDPLYASSTNAERLLLHAYELSLPHPFTKQEIHATAAPGLW